jgi:sulfite exporter TauE/SafE
LTSYLTEIGDGVFAIIIGKQQSPCTHGLYLGVTHGREPCPLATNITAIGFISKDIQSRNRIFWSGILYTLGRVISYTILGSILIPILREGASMFAIQKAISKYGDVFIAPALILIGLFMLLGNRLNLPKFGFSAGDKTQTLKGSWGSFAAGYCLPWLFVPQAACFILACSCPWRLPKQAVICCR